jgi:hypothetical protein
MKKFIKITLLIVFLPVIAIALAILHNNFGNDKYTQEDLKQAFNLSMQWLQHNNQKIQYDQNSMLWWMLMRAEAINNNPILHNTISQFKINNLTQYQHSPWSYLITGQSNPYISLNKLGNSLPDYNIHFIYSFSCSSSLANEHIIKIQNQTDFCRRYHPISPACATHQMMGFRFMQRTGCEEQQVVSNKISIMSDLIKRQSTYDFRVVDVYIQRILMQYDSGYEKKVNPRWIKRILRAQNADGGWGDFQPIIPLGGEKYIGFTAKGIGIRMSESSFHTTAQGIWLLAMMMQKQ